MLRRGVVVGIVVPLLWLLWGSWEHVAAAPGGYPGPTTTTAPGETSESQNGGRAVAGETVRIESCGFAVQQPENEVQAGPVGVDLTPEDPKTVFVDWNSDATGSAVVGDDGCARVDVAVQRQDADPPCPAVEVNGQARDGRRGRNDLVVRGEGANGAPRTVSTRLAISCSNGHGAAAASTSGDAGGPSSSSGGAGGDPGVTVDLAGNGVAISVTRTPIARTIAVGIGVLALATVLVLGDRVRRSRRAVL